jgi:hypothetical protein
MHRIDDSKFLITTGLTGDGQLVANHLRRGCQQFVLEKGEVPTVKETAEMAATIFHSLTKTGGRRPLACRAVIVGVDDGNDQDGTLGEADDNQSFRMRVFQTDPGGGIDECQDCLAVGKGQDALYKEIQKMIESQKNKKGKVPANHPQLLATLAQRTAAALERIGVNGQTSSSSSRKRGQHKHATTFAKDVWIIQPRGGRRGNMLATVYSHGGASDDISLEELIQNHHDEV